MGTIFVYLGYREWRARPRPGQPTQLPHWLDTVEHMRPLAAAGTGFVLYGIRPWLTELQAWMTQHNAAVMAVLLFLLGAVMIGKGIAAA